MHIASILHNKGTHVATIPGDVTASEATRVLERHGVGALVVSADGERIDGILSERDIVRALATHGAAALDLHVDQLMTREVTTCTADATTDELTAMMTAQRIRHVPVVSGTTLIGIVSIGDIVKHRLDELQVENHTLHDYINLGR